MKNKIALEEHFAIDLTIDQSKIYALPVIWEKLRANLLDIDAQYADVVPAAEALAYLEGAAP